MFTEIAGIKIGLGSDKKENIQFSMIDIMRIWYLLIYNTQKKNCGWLSLNPSQN